MNHIIISGPRRAGKTTTMLDAITLKATMNDNLVIVFITQTFQMKNQVKSHLLDRTCGQMIDHTNSAIRYKSGSVVYLYESSAAPNVRYLNADYIYADEPNDKVLTVLEHNKHVLEANDCQVMISMCDSRPSYGE